MGLVLSVFIYIESLAGATLATAFPLPIILGAGVVAVHIPIYIFERRLGEDRGLFWRGLDQRIPPGAVTCVKLLWLAVLGHFVWLFIKDHGAVPTIEGGQWILINRGRVVKILTEREYLILKAADLRAFAITMIASYMMPMLYGWFTRKSRPAMTSAHG